MKTGPERLREWIDRSVLKQRQAAELLGIHEVYLSQLLNGKREPGLANAIKIEHITGISAESWVLSEISDAADAAMSGARKRNQAKR